MNRILKLFVIIVAGLALIAVIAALVLPKVIDPNDFRDEISTLVYDSTGLTLNIDGPVGWSVFPWLGLTLQDVNVKGSGEQPFAELGTAEVSVKLVPLLSKSVEMQTARLIGLKLNLIKDKNGKGNWEAHKPASTQTATPETTSTEAQPSTPDQKPLQIHIASVIADDLVLIYQDQASGKSYTIDQASLQTGAIINREFFDFTLQARMRSNEPALVFQSELSGQFKFDLALGKYNLKDMKLSTRPDVTRGEALSLVGQFDVQQKPLEINGRLDATEFNPEKLLNQIKITLPPMAAPDALSKLSFNSRFRMNSDSLTADTLKLNLDDFSIGGNFKITDFKTNTMVFQFTGNDLNLDNYLPPPSETADKSASSEKPAPAKGSESPLIPEDALRPLNLSGSLQLNSLTVAKLTFEQPNVKLSAANGRQEVKINSAFYKGTINLDSKLDVRQEGTPEVTAKATLKGIDLQAVAEPVPAFASIQGNVNADLDVNTRGQLQSTLTRNLNGTIGFDITKGAFTRANFDRLVCEAIATIRNKDLQEKEWNSATDFKKLSGSFVIKNGVASNDNLTAALTNLNLKGDGNVNLVEQTLDYHVGLNISGETSPDSDPACQVNEDYVNVTWPVRCQGKLGEQHCGLDTKRLAETIAGLATREVKSRIEDEIEKKVDGPLKDVLKGFFQ